MRASLAAVVLAIATCAASAQAEDGSFVRVGLGGGRLRGRTTTAPSHPSVLDSFAYFGTGADLAIGERVGQFVFGGAMQEHGVQLDDAFRAKLLGGSYSMNLFTIGPMMEWHRDAWGGPWVGGTFGLSSFSGGTDSPPRGGALSVSGGWDFPASERSVFGVYGRVTYARLDADERGRLDLFSPMILLSFARR